MKKNIFRILAVILCLLMAFSVVACTESDTDADSKNSDDTSKSSFSIKYNGAEIKLGANWSDVESKLGAPVSSLPTGNCGGLGETYRNDYSAVAITVVHYTDGSPIVDRITVKSDAATTDKGIYIGSSKSDLTNAYGTPAKENETSVIYVDGNAEFTFGISDGKVDSITLAQNG